MKKLMTLALVLTLALGLMLPALAEDASDCLVVTGTATVTLQPDTATIELGAQTRANSVGEAYRENSKVMDGLIAKVMELGLAREDIRTSQFNVYFEQAYDSMSTGAIRGNFNVTNMIVITIRDISKVSDILDAASQAGANNIYGLTFSSSKSTEAYHQALKKAVEDASAKAEVLAQAAGRTLGRIVKIEDTPIYGVPYGMENRISFEDAKASGAPILAGDASVVATVSLQFELK